TLLCYLCFNTHRSVEEWATRGHSKSSKQVNYTPIWNPADRRDNNDSHDSTRQEDSAIIYLLFRFLWWNLIRLRHRSNDRCDPLPPKRLEPSRRSGHHRMDHLLAHARCRTGWCSRWPALRQARTPKDDSFLGAGVCGVLHRLCNCPRQRMGLPRCGSCVPRSRSRRSISSCPCLHVRDSPCQRPRTTLRSQPDNDCVRHARVLHRGILPAKSSRNHSLASHAWTCRSARARALPWSSSTSGISSLSHQERTHRRSSDSTDLHSRRRCS